MAEVVWTEPALQELDAIAEYIALDNPTAAERLVKEVLDQTERLQDSPRSGRTPPELPGSIYREELVPPCRLLHRQDANRVWILYAMRDERKLRAFMLDPPDDTP